MREHLARAAEGMRIAVGHDPRSPFYRHRPSLREQISEARRRVVHVVEEEVKREARRGLRRVPGFRTAKRDSEKMVTAAHLAKANPYAGAAYVVVHPVSAGRSVLRTVLVVALLAWVFFVAVVQPTLDRWLGWMPDTGWLPNAAPGLDEYGRLREFDRNLPPGWTPLPGAPWAGVVPGSLSETCPGLAQPASTGPQVRVGGWEGVGHAAGRLLRAPVEVDLSMERFEEGIVSTARGVGEFIRAFQSAARDGTPTPTQTPTVQTLEGPPPGAVVIQPADMSTSRLTDVQVAELARAVGWPEREIPIVVARVKAESGGDPHARDYVDGSHQGLLQMGQAEQRAYMPGEDPFDPRANLRGARKLWEARGWQPWRASDATARTHLEAGRRAAALGGVAPAPHVPVAACGEIQLASMGGDVTPANAAEAELSRNAIRARRAILAEFPGTTIGGWGERPNRTEHDDRDPVTGRKAARALDVMTYEDMVKGERVAQWVRANWDALRVEYLIWDRRIWTHADSSRPYRGASPHTDHPHITFTPDPVEVNA